METYFFTFTINRGIEFSLAITVYDVHCLSRRLNQ